jgi:hypothetical protein
VSIVHLSMTGDRPIIPVLVGVSNLRFQVLRAANQPQPQPINVSMLVDTGSSRCCITPGLLAPLGLTSIGKIPLHTPSTGGAPVSCDLYEVSFMIPHPHSPLFLPVMPIVECCPLSGPVQGLLGRDFLKRCLLVYEGQAQTFALAF